MPLPPKGPRMRGAWCHGRVSGDGYLKALWRWNMSQFKTCSGAVVSIFKIRLCCVSILWSAAQFVEGQKLALDYEPKALVSWNRGLCDDCLSGSWHYVLYCSSWWHNYKSGNLSSFDGLKLLRRRLTRRPRGCVEAGCLTLVGSYLTSPE